MMKQEQQNNRYFGGIMALAGVIFIWVSSSFTMNSLFGEMEYSKPFLITYINTATFSFYLIPLLFKRIKSKYQQYSTAEERYSLLDNTNKKPINYVAVNEIKPSTNEKLSTVHTIKLSLQFCILWFLANYTTNASLAYTSVGSSTILSSMSGLFTLGIGALFKVEKMNLVKIMAVLISLVGVSFVSYSDTKELSQETVEQQVSPIIGDILALLGAFFYGCYTTLLKLKIGDEDRIDMPLFFGFVGAFNLLFLWPVIPILNYTGLETFEIPMNGTLWAVIIINAFIGTFVSDYLWLVSMLMTSPLVVTLGISLTIPLALMGDVLFKGFVPNLNYILGALLVVVGFLAVNTNAIHQSKQVVQDEKSTSATRNMEEV